MKFWDAIKGKLVSFVSKKLLVIIITVIVIKGNALIGAPLDEQSVSNLIAAVCTYLGGQALVDMAAAFGKKKAVDATAPASLPLPATPPAATAPAGVGSIDMG